MYDGLHIYCFVAQSTVDVYYEEEDNYNKVVNSDVFRIAVIRKLCVNIEIKVNN